MNKNKLKKIIRLLFIAFLFLSCLKCNTSANKNNPNVIEIEFPSTPNNKLIDEHLVLSEVIMLETSDASLVQRINKVIKFKDKIIILNGKDEILIFNADGRFLNKINKRGAGPGEYNNIVDIALDDINGNIIVYSDNFKLFVFNLLGEFIFQIDNIDNKKLFERISFDKNLLYFYNPLNTSGENIIEVFDIDSKEYTHSMNSHKSVDFILKPMGVPIVKSKDIWYAIPLNNKLLNVSQKNTYKINIKNFGVPKGLLKTQYEDTPNFLKEINRNKICYALTSIRETDDFLYFKSNIHEFIRLDKKDKTIMWTEHCIDSVNKIKNLRYFPHDSEKKEIMFIANSNNFEDLSKLFKDDELVESTYNKDDMNPILLFYKEK